MSLLAYNLTTTDVVLTGVVPATTLPASTAAGLRGAPVDVTAELEGLTGPQYVALQNQANPSPGTPSALVVAYVWTGLQEFTTPGLAVSAAPFTAADDFLIWVGPAGVVGAGGTATDPTTPTDAFSRLPTSWDRRCQMLFLPGSYAPLTVSPRCGRPSGAATATPFVMIGDFTNVLGDRTSTAASATGDSITDAGLTGALTVATTLTAAINATVTTIPVASVAGLPANGFVQIDSEIISYAAISALNLTGCQRGAGAGAASHLIAAAVSMESPYRGHFISIVVAGVVTQRREIVSNTAGGQFNVNAKFSPIPVAGDIFRVEAPAVQISTGTGLNAFAQSGSWGQKGIFWDCSAGGSFNTIEQSSCLSSEGIWYRGPSVAGRPNNLVVRASLFRGQSQPAPWTADGVNNPFSNSRAQAGVTYRYMLLSAQYGRIENMSVVLDSCNVSCTEGATGQFFSPFGRFSTISIARCGIGTQITNDSSASPIVTIMDVGDGGNQPIQLTALSVLRNVTGALQINNSQVSAILVNSGALFQNLGTASATINITGTGNVRYGVEILTAGQFQLLNQGITLTGLLGDLKVGQKPAMTWAQFRARYPQASAPSNVAADYVPAAPFKKVFTGLVAADSFDITTLGPAPLPSPALAVSALRVVTATLNTGPYLCTDSGGTPFASAGGAFGVATLSDDGKTVTFPAGTLATAFTIEYVPCDPVNVSGAYAVNNSV